MTIFSKLIEDPMYDEDGVMIDEDAEWTDTEDPADYTHEVERFDPYDTVNS